MRAVGVTEFGGPEVLGVVEIPEAHAGPGEIRLRVAAATVNPTDTMTRNGARADALTDRPPPYVPGMDAAGVVDEIGEGTETELAVGDRAMAIVVPHHAYGAYSEHVVVPAGSATHVPAGADDAAASTLPMNALTARQALDLLALSPGETLAVTGAAGSFGGYAVQLAKADGLRVLADASEADEDLVRALGADVVVRRGDGVAARFREIAPDGVDGVADGAVLDDDIMPAVRDGGGIATVRGYTGPGERGVSWHPVWVGSYAQEHDKLVRLREQVESGAVTLRVAGTFPADRAAEAHRRLEAGGVRGRHVITFD